MIICTMPGCQTTAGCQCKPSWNATADLGAWERHIRNETREECAQAIEAIAQDIGDIWLIWLLAAAIRALKDKPNET